MANASIENVIIAAFECSVYAAPRDFGLSLDEVIEVCSALNFRQGETREAVASSHFAPYSDGRLLPIRAIRGIWEIFGIEGRRHLVATAIFDFVVFQLKELCKEVGATNARLERDVIVERAAIKGIPRREVEGAISMLVASGHFSENEGLVAFVGARHTNPLPSEQERQNARHSSPAPELDRNRIYGIVCDVVERRLDGRRASARPLLAFADALHGLGYGPFRMWWVQTANELERCSAEDCATAICVLSAALMEGALTFVVRYAKSLNLGLFGSRDLNDKPSSWRIDNLISGASHGSSAILDAPSQQRARGLVATRQRIHAGRMLDDHPNGLHDLKPEQARDAKATAELIIRRILDWLDQHPTT